MADAPTPPDSPPPPETPPPDDIAERIAALIGYAQAMGDDQLLALWQILWRDKTGDVALEGGGERKGTEEGAGSGRTEGRTDEEAEDRPYRVRADGWTQARQMTFLGTLAKTGCVRDACRVAAISTTSAYRYRTRDAGFARAWARALAEASPALEAAAYQRAVEGVDEPIVSGGKIIGNRKKYSDPLLKTLIDRDDIKTKQRIGGQPGVITWEEWQARWRFDWDGAKYQEEDPEAIRARIAAKLSMMHKRVCREPVCAEGGRG